jgi:hypothetical protein
MSREEEDGFLGRWSRLKRKAAVPEPDVASAPEPLSAEAPHVVHSSEPVALSAEELAALPRIEDLVEGSDIRAFLRAGVPRDLRNAALRRIWMLTPAIRDYRDPAVDYAWDWNTPGGVPGDGAAPSPERAAEMLRTLLAPREETAEEASPQDAPEAADGTAALAEVPGDAGAAALAPDAATAGQEAASDRAAALPDPAPDEMPRRRHGSALPG